MIKGHGDDVYQYARPITANFSSNVFGRINLDGLKRHLCNCMDEIGNYPEPEPYTLEAGLAKLHHLQADEVCVTNGATEAIYLIAQTFRGTNTAICQPTFSEYADACRMHEHRVTALFMLPTEKEQYRLPSDIRMLWLCNPNNPTGRVVRKEELKRLVEQNPKVCFVIDQSYEFFTLSPLFTVEEAVYYPNVLLLHSMTKRYAMPGLRLGYVTGCASLLERLRVNRMPWSVNQLAIQAGMYLLAHSNEIPVDMVAYLEEANRLRERLQALGAMEVWDTETHFMLVCLRFGKASALKEYLANQHGILIRDASNFEGLDDRFFRIAAQTPEENKWLVDAIKKWLEE
ncbi:MAG: pyridoxal phosphate-dependent class II aminotransferase [Bacteroides sp.]|nr:pyridoxal phosphate-dependent class II aminotransferase [Bacteroidaceae bacterium]MBP3668710.1 pyridoxal phosphate-dependent class II aminotransferase [Bacteroides sp.]MBQ8602544.1 pyridoxal phosphate-dependent class II aminotransferase [Bacteroides sp.]